MRLIFGRSVDKQYRLSHTVGFVAVVVVGVVVVVVAVTTAAAMMAVPMVSMPMSRPIITIMMTIACVDE